jgi:RND superfamily putative drug exporter
MSGAVGGGRWRSRRSSLPAVRRWPRPRCWRSERRSPWRRGWTTTATVAAVQLLGGAPGVAFTLPLVIFLFVVAVGTDYNVLIAARLREELGRRDRPPREAGRGGGARRARGRRGGARPRRVVRNAHLAADPGTRETGFPLAVGIPLAALVVSGVLVPALVALGVKRPRAVRPVGEPAADHARERGPAGDDVQIRELGAL